MDIYNGTGGEDGRASAERVLDDEMEHLRYRYRYGFSDGNELGIEHKFQRLWIAISKSGELLVKSL